MDEYAQLVKDFKQSGIIKDHRKGLLHVYKNSFVGKEAVDWLMFSKKIGKYFSCIFGVLFVIVFDSECMTGAETQYIDLLTNSPILSPYFSYKNTREKLLKYQENTPWVIISSILMTSGVE